MYNPDDPRERKEQMSHPAPPPTTRVMTPAENFRIQLLQSSLVLNGHGIGFKQGQPVVIDQARLDSVTGWRKDVIRGVWKELHAAYAKKRGEHSPPSP